MGRNFKHNNCKVLEHFLDHKGGHKSVWETEVEVENDNLLSLLKNISGSDVNAVDIAERMANDVVNELTDIDIVKMMAQIEVTEEKEEDDG